MVRIYRVETVAGFGPYVEGMFEPWEFELWRQPPPHEDGINLSHWHKLPVARFGFRSIPDVLQWFYDDERSHLDRNCYWLTEYEVYGKVVEGYKQCVFDAGAAKRVARYHLLDL